MLRELTEDKVVGIVGSREFPQLELVIKLTREVQRYASEIVTGDASGVDVTVETCVRGVTVMRADWQGGGKRAGMERNMLLVNSVDVLFAFWDGTSRGTEHAIGRARIKGIPTVIVRC
jgi:hypothetical protein